MASDLGARLGHFLRAGVLLAGAAGLLAPGARAGPARVEPALRFEPVLRFEPALRAQPSAATTQEATLAGVAAPLAPSPVPPVSDAAVPAHSVDERQLESEARGLVIRTILGLLALVALSWIGGLPQVRRFEEWLGITHVVTAGFPFVLLGVVGRLPQVGILSDGVLHDLSPVLQFGLGWIGFLTGFRFDVRVLDRLPRGASQLVALVTTLPFLLVVVACGAILYAFDLLPGRWTLVRDALTVGIAGALAAPVAAKLLGSRGVPPYAAELRRTVYSLDDIVGVLGLACLGAFFRPPGAGLVWQLPGMGWLFVTIGVGSVLGLVVYWMLQRPATPPEALAILLGSVAFAAGLAGHLSLSPIVICFCTGVVVTNVPGVDRARWSAALERLERPIYLLFLVVVGALWEVQDWRGWALVPFFVLARISGRALGTVLARRRVRASADQSLLSVFDERFVVAPMGALSIAIVIDHQSLYGGEVIPLLVTAVLGSAIVTEILLQLASRTSSPRRVAVAKPGGGPAPSGPE